MFEYKQQVLKTMSRFDRQRFMEIAFKEILRENLEDNWSSSKEVARKTIKHVKRLEKAYNKEYGNEQT